MHRPASTTSTQLLSIPTWARATNPLSPPPLPRGHPRVDLYDRQDKIPFDTITGFFDSNLT